jgi:hypothetical protein
MRRARTVERATERLMLTFLFRAFCAIALVAYVAIVFF